MNRFVFSLDICTEFFVRNKLICCNTTLSTGPPSCIQTGYKNECSLPFDC